MEKSYKPKDKKNKEKTLRAARNGNARETAKAKVRRYKSKKQKKDTSTQALSAAPWHEQPAGSSSWPREHYLASRAW